jgi:hypothetical protein
MKTLAKALGWVSVAANLTFWGLIFNPFGVEGFEGDVLLTAALCFLALASSLVACSSSRWWALSVALSILSVVVFELSLK